MFPDAVKALTPRHFLRVDAMRLVPCVTLTDISVARMKHNCKIQREKRG
jgi:hypothetical protein